MSPEEIKTWVAIAIGAVSLAGTAWTFLSHRSRDNSSKLEELQGRMSETEASVKSLAREMEHLPSKEQVHQLELNMTELGGAVKAIGETVRSLRHTTESIDGFLRNNKGS